MIRRAETGDAMRMAEIHVFGWRSAYRNIVSDSYLFSTLSVGKRFDAFNDILKEDKRETYVYEEDGIIKGFMTIGNCRNEDKKDAFELWGLYIEPLMKRTGIGTKMIKYCEEQARIRGYKENVLWVLKENKNARKFYETMGYREDGKEELLEKINAEEIRYAKELK